MAPGENEFDTPVLVCFYSEYNLRPPELEGAAERGRLFQSPCLRHRSQERGVTCSRAPGLLEVMLTRPELISQILLLRPSLH